MQVPIRVLFLSDGNAARSQMAEALLRKLGGESFQVSSAGLDLRPLHALAVQAMAEIGIDLSSQGSKHLNQYLDTRFDQVITLCGRDRHFCPDFPHDGETLHWVYEDPSEADGTDAEKLAAYRRARDEIRLQLESWLATVMPGRTA